MKRRLSSEDFCTEGNIMAKKRKIRRGKKDWRKPGPRSSSDSSKVPRTESCTSDTSSHNSETAGKLSAAEEYALISKEIRDFEAACALISEEIHDLETACEVSQTDCAANTLDNNEVAGDTNVAAELQQNFQSNDGTISESNNDACLLSQADILGLFQGLSNTYNLTEVSPQEQPFHVVSDGTSMYLVGPQNQVYMSLVPPTGSSAATTTDSQMVCTVHDSPDQSNQLTDNINKSQQFISKSFSERIKERLDNWYDATMDVDRREADLLRYPSHLLEWSERVKFSHQRKWKRLKYHEPKYSEWDFL
ncbi:uncharacterized protein LOC134265127 isoform X1 [Saccostrea cucullata]|uniref:uncharacterized protein LOC134265127 isoform X1 n=1 Tax=Saccostrea cuccullata TaxID=36930 RepID=UPI002ED36729